MKSYNSYCHDIDSISKEKDAFRQSVLISLLPVLKMYINLAARKANGKKPFPIGFGYQIKDKKFHSLIKEIEDGIETGKFKFTELTEGLREAIEIVKETEEYIKMMSLRDDFRWIGTTIGNSLLIIED